MKIWNQFPLLRILLPFLAGIIVSLSVEFNIPFSLIISFAFLICMIIILHKKILGNYKMRWIFGLLLNIFLFLFGYKITDNCKANNRPDDFSHFHTTSDTIIVTVDDPVNEKENSISVLLAFDALKQNNKWIKVSGKAMTYFTKDSLSKKLKYGDRLIVTAGFTDVSRPQNPGEFNYKNYLSLRSIFTQGFIKSGKWQLLSHGNGNIIRALAIKIREKFLKIFAANNITGEEYAVAGAVILGYKDKIDADLFSVYQGTGVLHLLCVAGMHVGIIFIVLNFLLAFLDKNEKTKIIKPILLILMIWFYAAITGFSPPVNRAAVMITFVIFGKALNRNMNIYNTLSASVLLFLIIDPLLIANVGFQFSYIAVFGIVSLQKRIYQIWIPENWLMHKIWLIVTVSIAAQIATFPIALYYYKQFPNYFLLANIVVVPFSNLIIYCGMLVLLFSPVNFLSGLSAKILVNLIYWLNHAIRFIEGMPMSVTKGIHITMIEMILLYFEIILIIYSISTKNKLFLKLTAIIAIVFASSIAITSFKSSEQKKFIVYSINKSSAIDLISGKNHVFLSDSALKNNPKALAMHIKSNWDDLQLKEPECVANKDSIENYFLSDDHTIFIKRNFIQFYNKRIVMVDRSDYTVKSASPIDIDYLIISGNIKTKISKLLESYNPKMIIIDSSNSLYRSEKWINECAELKIPYYSVLKSGAFEIDI